MAATLRLPQDLDEKLSDYCTRALMNVLGLRACGRWHEWIVAVSVDIVPSADVSQFDGRTMELSVTDLPRAESSLVTETVTVASF